MWISSVMALNFVVDFLLLLATNRLTGHEPNWKRCSLAAVIGGIYGGSCLIPGFSFLGSVLWRTVALTLICLAAYGMTFSGFRRGLIFVFLSMALSGIVQLHRGGFLFLMGAGCAIYLLCAVGFGGKLGREKYLPVELNYGGKQMKLTALFDTGNTLRDPLTGKSVLVLEGKSASRLTGLTENQLRQPIENMQTLPGLRLIPYRSVGQPNGMLLALRVPEMKIGAWAGSGLVALSPDSLSPENAYQALTGGTLG